MKCRPAVLVFAITIASNARGAVVYDASLGTLPQGQGWVYSGDGGNPSPYVSGNALHEVKNVVDTDQYWTDSLTFDVTQHIFLQGVLQIDSSNYVANIGTGTREGYYFFVSDTNALGYSIGLSDNGFSINTVVTPNAALSPYAIAGGFHTYTFEVNQGLGKFYIDGILLQSNIAPYLTGDVNAVYFGASAGRSISTSDLNSVCATSSGTCSVSSAPEPSTMIFVGGSPLLFLIASRLFKRQRRVKLITLDAAWPSTSSAIGMCSCFMLAASLSYGQVNVLPGSTVVTTGKVGVQTATPTASLEVKAPSVGTNDLLRLIEQNNNANWAFRYVDADGSLRLVPSSGLYPFVVGDGRVASAAPARVEIQSPSNGYNSLLRFMDNIGTAYWDFSYRDTDGSLNLVPLSGNYPLNIFSNSTNFSGDVYSRGVKLGPGFVGGQGPLGPAGPPGPQGPTGATGPTVSLVAGKNIAIQQSGSAFTISTTAGSCSCSITCNDSTHQIGLTGPSGKATDIQMCVNTALAGCTYGYRTAICN